MYIKRNGYVGGAALLLPIIKKLRQHVEFEKFQARVLVDNEKTREFKMKTENLKDKLYAFRYNGPLAEKLTAAGKKRDSNASK